MWPVGEDLGKLDFIQTLLYLRLPYSDLFSWPNLLYDQIAMTMSNWGILGVLGSHGAWGERESPDLDCLVLSRLFSDPGASEVCIRQYVTVI